MPEPSRPSVVRLQIGAGRPDRNRCWALVMPSASLFPDFVFRTWIPLRAFIPFGTSFRLRLVPTANGATCLGHAAYAPRGSSLSRLMPSYSINGGDPRRLDHQTCSYYPSLDWDAITCS